MRASQMSPRLKLFHVAVMGAFSSNSGINTCHCTSETKGMWCTAYCHKIHNNDLYLNIVPQKHCKLCKALGTKHEIFRLEGN